MHRFSMDRLALQLLGALALGSLPSCTSADAGETSAPRDDEPALRAQPLSAGRPDQAHPGKAQRGKKLFDLVCIEKRTVSNCTSRSPDALFTRGFRYCTVEDAF